MEVYNEIDHYEVELKELTLDPDKQHSYTVRHFDTMEEAVEFAREKMGRFRVTVRVIENIIGWWI